MKRGFLRCMGLTTRGFSRHGASGRRWSGFGRLIRVILGVGVLVGMGVERTEPVSVFVKKNYIYIGKWWQEDVYFVEQGNGKKIALMVFWDIGGILL
jgi:hypothetical protein